MRSYWGRMGPKFNMTSVLTRRGKETEAHKGRSHVITETEVGVMQL